MTAQPSSNRLPVADIEGVLFDMDGVLVDSEPLHEFTLLELSEQFGRRYEHHADLQAFKGLPEMTSARRMLAQFPHVKLEPAEIIKKRLDLVRANYHMVKIIEGVRGFLERCRAAGLTVGLTTSADLSIQELAFQTFDLGRFFDAIVTGRDVKIGKPDPEPYLLTAARLGLPPGRCLVVEDAVNGVVSGKAAGCQVAAITTSFPEAELRAAGADLIAASFAVLEAEIFGAPENTYARR